MYPEKISELVYSNGLFSLFAASLMAAVRIVMGSLKILS